MQEFKAGDIIKVKRDILGLTYYHFGVYIGDGKVVHFTNYSYNDPNSLDMEKAYVQETEWWPFAMGGDVELDTQEEPKFYRESIVARANISKGKLLGEYNLLTKNCEHFANWCRMGEYKCNQSLIVLETLLAKIAFLALLGRHKPFPFI